MAGSHLLTNGHSMNEQRVLLCACVCVCVSTRVHTWAFVRVGLYARACTDTEASSSSDKHSIGPGCAKEGMVLIKLP